jgi:hypothetical protein
MLFIFLCLIVFNLIAIFMPNKTAHLRYKAVFV